MADVAGETVIHGGHGVHDSPGHTCNTHLMHHDHGGIQRVDMDPRFVDISCRSIEYYQY